jgi:hypothetical protein
MEQSAWVSLRSSHPTATDLRKKRQDAASTASARERFAAVKHENFRASLRTLWADAHVWMAKWAVATFL